MRKHNNLVIPVNVKMVVSDNMIIVRVNDRYFNLNGEDVKEILIPILEELKKGVNYDTLVKDAAPEKIDRINKILHQLINRGWLVDDFLEEEKFNFYTNYSTVGLELENIKEILKNKTVGLINLDCRVPKDSNLDSLVGVKELILENIKLDFGTIENKIRDFTKDLDLIILIETESNDYFEKIVNRICFENKQPLLLVKVFGFIAEIGPLVIPPYTSCIECYRTRKYNNLTHYQEHQIVEEYLENNEPTKIHKAYSVDPFVCDMAVSFMGNQIIQYFLSDETWNFPKVIESVIEIDSFNTIFTVDKLLKLPNCNICGKTYENQTTNKFWTKTYKYQ